MIAYLDEAIGIHSLIWLFLVAFMLHDFEEIIRIEPWFRKHYASAGTVPEGASWLRDDDVVSVRRRRLRGIRRVRARDVHRCGAWPLLIVSRL